jgi:hypothetical protein
MSGGEFGSGESERLALSVAGAAVVGWKTWAPAGAEGMSNMILLKWFHPLFLKGLASGCCLTVTAAYILSIYLDLFGFIG